MLDFFVLFLLRITMLTFSEYTALKQTILCPCNILSFFSSKNKKKKNVGFFCLIFAQNIHFWVDVRNNEYPQSMFGSKIRKIDIPL